MITIPIEYDEGKITIQGVAPKVKTHGRLVLEDVPQEKKNLDLRLFHFAEAQEFLKDYKGSLSEAVIEERRSGR